jgi:hypothetical protein
MIKGRYLDNVLDKTTENYLCKYVSFTIGNIP